LATVVGCKTDGVDRFRRTPLHWAARFNNPIMIDVLCEAGVKTSQLDSEMNTASSLAQYHNHAEVLIKLKKQEALQNENERKNKQGKP